MSLRDEVARLPGGAELSELAGKVDGDPAAVRAVAARWRSAAGKVSEYTGGLGGAVAEVDAAWRGESADAFAAYMRRYGRAGDALHDALTDCASALDTAAGALEGAESRVGSIMGTLLADVAAHRERNPGRTDKDLEPGIRSLVGQALSDARPHVEAAGKAVTAAKNAVTKHLAGRPATFAGIAAPGDERFVPAPGRTVDWERTAGYRPQGGTGNGGNGGGGNGGGGNGQGGGFGGYGPSGPPPPGGGPAPTGQVKEWIEQAVEILKAQGYPAEKMNPSDIWMIIQHESGGNPHAINNWDSNAAAGIPSKGLMQTIDPTFDRWSLPGHKDIYAPVDNIIAGVRYAIERYGSVSAVPGVVGTKNGTGYVGY
ncbi:WXG100 family type VII secretion target [Planomonospora algeriensis]